MPGNRRPGALNSARVVGQQAAGLRVMDPSYASAAQGLIDNLVVGLLDLKGDLNCSANPGYPNGQKGDFYFVSAAGKIGGAAGKAVDIGDAVVASSDNPGGTEGAVGASWFVLEHNMAGLSADSPWTSFVPAITAGSGALTAVAATAQYRKVGRTVFLRMDITVTTNGTGADSIHATVPADIQFLRVTALAGVETVNTGAALSVVGEAAAIDITRYDATYPAADGARLVLTGTYETLAA